MDHTLTYTKRTAGTNGSAFRRAYNVTRAGVPFALLANFSIEQGGGWYAGLANCKDGGTFPTRAAAEAFIEENA